MDRQQIRRLLLQSLKWGPRRLGQAYISRLCRNEYCAQRFERHNERAIEFGFLFRQLAWIQPKTVLDVGTGTTALPHLIANCGCVVTAVDNVKDYWPEGMANRHWHIQDDDITCSRLGRQFDLVTCISVLEHVRDHEAAVANMFRLVQRSGYLVLTFPYNDRRYEPNVYALSGAAYGQDQPYVCQSYSRREVEGWLAANGGRIVEQQFWQFWTGDVWTQGSRLSPPRQVAREEKHQLTCLLIQRNS